MEEIAKIHFTFTGGHRRDVSSCTRFIMTSGQEVNPRFRSAVAECVHRTGAEQPHMRYVSRTNVVVRLPDSPFSL